MLRRYKSALRILGVYESPLSLELEPDSFSSVTLLSRSAIPALKSIINDEYFKNLESYGDRGYWFDKNSGRTSDYRNGFHLFPPNIFALQVVRDIRPKSLIDFGCGLGNFLGYVKHVCPSTIIRGVDNFSQISREHVHAYQRMTFGISVEPFSPIEPQVIVCMGVPVHWVWNDILKLKPATVIIETVSVREPFQLGSYRVEFANKFIAVLVRKLDAEMAPG